MVDPEDVDRAVVGRLPELLAGERDQKLAPGRTAVRLASEHHVEMSSPSASPSSVPRIVWYEPLGFRPGELVEVAVESGHLGVENRIGHPEIVVGIIRPHSES